MMKSLRRLATCVVKAPFIWMIISRTNIARLDLFVVKGNIGCGVRDIVRYAELCMRSFLTCHGHIFGVVSGMMF
jgi:hypothetical protein